MSTMPLCPRCLKGGTHSRLKRVYYRLIGKYSEIGWFCPSCCEFTLDYQAFVNDENRIFDTGLDVPELKKQIAGFKKRNDAAEKLEKIKSVKMSEFEK